MTQFSLIPLMFLYHHTPYSYVLSSVVCTYFVRQTILLNSYFKGTKNSVWAIVGVASYKGNNTWETINTSMDNKAPLYELVVPMCHTSLECDTWYALLLIATLLRFAVPTGSTRWILAQRRERGTLMPWERRWPAIITSPSLGWVSFILRRVESRDWWEIWLDVSKSALPLALNLVYSVCLEIPKISATLVLDMPSDNKYLASSRLTTVGGCPFWILGNSQLPVDSAFLFH